MFQMISVAFPPDRDIWREFGSNATVMRLSGRGRGTGRIPFSLRSCAISLSFFYFFLPLCCSLSFFLRIPSLSFTVFLYNSFHLVPPLQPISGLNLSILFLSVWSTTSSFFPLYDKFAFFWEHCQIEPQNVSLSRKATWKDQPKTGSSFKGFLTLEYVRCANIWKKLRCVWESAFWCIYGGPRHKNTQQSWSRMSRQHPVWRV